MEMEKYAHVKRKKVRNYISNDLVFSILSKLSLKSLKRFGVVDKSWFLLFENSHFMRTYRNNLLSNNHCYYDDTFFLIHLNMIGNIDHPCYQFKMELYMLYGERFENTLNIEWPNPFQDDYPGFDILGSSSINGILCIYRYVKANVLAVLWNLSTKELQVVPCLPDESMIEGDTLLGFGFDHLKQDYKVIRKTIFYSHIRNEFSEYTYETTTPSQNISKNEST